MYCMCRVITESKAAASKSSEGGSGGGGGAIGFLQALMLPNVMSYAFAFGFFKLVSTSYACCAVPCILGVMDLCLP